MTADHEFVERLLGSVRLQEGQGDETQDLDPLLSLGRQSHGSRGVGAAPLALSELPLVEVDTEAGQLEVREPIGSGGMGQVDLAHQRCLRRDIALKRLHPDADAGAEQALIQEALHTGALEHPNVVPVHQLGRDAEGKPLLLMQRVSGAEWLDLIEDPQHPRWEELGQDRLGFHLDVLRQVCNALHFAHSRSILHLDVKPANVMLGQYGEVYLLDWGLSTRADAPHSPERPVVGTPAYFAPEMADTTQPLSVQTDVYLLGSTLHHVLTGEPRHTSGPDGMRSVIYSAYRSEPFPYPPEVPAELADLCRRATHRDPTQRPASALEFRQGLEAFLRHRGSVRTCAAAESALQRLQATLSDPETDREGLIASFTAARLGFEAALADWEGNLAAREGLQACLELRIGHELEQRNKGVAEELLLRLPEPRPVLEERLAALTRQLEEEAQSHEALETIRDELDVTGAGRSRAALFLLLGVLSGVGLLTVAALYRLGWLRVGWELKTFYKLALPLVYVIGLYAARKSLLQTRGRRKIAICAGLLFLSPLAATGISSAIEPVNKTSLASTLQAVILTVMALTLDRRIGWIALAIGLTALGCMFWPEYWLEIQGVGAFSGFAIAAKVTQPVLRDA